MGLTWQLSGKEPACQMRVQSLSWEDPLEEEMATHSGTLGLGNPMDRGAWWVTVHEATKSQTPLSEHTEHR